MNFWNEIIHDKDELERRKFVKNPDSVEAMFKTSDQVFEAGGPQ